MRMVWHDPNLLGQEDVLGIPCDLVAPKGVNHGAMLSSGVGGIFRRPEQV